MNDDYIDDLAYYGGVVLGIFTMFGIGYWMVTA